jgi:homospermidine synthase
MSSSLIVWSHDCCWAQYGFLVAHNESISIADYLAVREAGKGVYRPTWHYACR